MLDGQAKYLLLQAVGLIGRAWPFSRPVPFFSHNNAYQVPHVLVKKKSALQLRTRQTDRLCRPRAPQRTEVRVGSWVSGWYGPTCESKTLIRTGAGPPPPPQECVSGLGWVECD